MSVGVGSSVRPLRRPRPALATRCLPREVATRAPYPAASRLTRSLAGTLRSTIAATGGNETHLSRCTWEVAGWRREDAGLPSRGTELVLLGCAGPTAAFSAALRQRSCLLFGSGSEFSVRALGGAVGRTCSCPSRAAGSPGRRSDRHAAARTRVLAGAFDSSPGDARRAFRHARRQAGHSQAHARVGSPRTDIGSRGPRRPGRPRVTPPRSMVRDRLRSPGVSMITPPVGTAYRPRLLVTCRPR